MAAHSRPHEHPVVRSDSHNKGRSLSRATRGAHGTNPAAALRVSRAQLNEDAVVVPAREAALGRGWPGMGEQGSLSCSQDPRATSGLL